LPLALADAECFGEGSDSNPACEVPECKRQHTENFHEMMTSMELSVNSVAYEEEDEDGYVSLVGGDRHYTDNNRWRTPDASWSELEPNEDIMQVYHVNIIMEEDDIMKEKDEMFSEEVGGEGKVEDQATSDAVQMVEEEGRADEKRDMVRKRRAKRKRTCVGEVDRKKLKQDAEIRDLLTSDSNHSWVSLNQI
jgi:hypothetical protein